MEQLQDNGYAICASPFDDRVISSVVSDAETAFSGEETGRRRGGIRFPQHTCPALNRLIESHPVRELSTNILGPSARLVRTILFDKTPGANWKVAWHQDLSIAVREKRDVEGYGPWSVKSAIPHVQPPAKILENMITLRIHLDPCNEENGPLKVIPNSHRSGKLNPEHIAEWVRDHESIACTGDVGSIVLMRPLLLHASSPATAPAHRRILHLEFSGTDLPGGLAWRVDE